jgi:nitroimidazol reductase NimA-like FMN-containing flavoprotein (pyridoxamine 5'-phosphate oxidase superfamily)
MGTSIEKEELVNLINKLFSSQLLAVLGTHSQRGPYGNLVAFAATDDLKNLIFATTRSTRKYENLMETPRVSMVMDNRSNREIDFQEAVAVTATGTVKEIHGSDRDYLKKLYLKRHPYLVDFVDAPTCALLKVNVETYYIVRRFQQVTELRITS